MKVVVVTLLLAAVTVSTSEAAVVGYHHHAAALVPAAALVRTPNLDSAVVHSERVGGNFAYSTVEGHAYTALAPPVVHHVQPVAVAYSAQPVVAQPVVAHPVVAPLPVFHAAAPLPAVYAPAKTFYYAH